MDYSRFYTPPEIASILVKELDISNPSTIIDICCGSCNLLRAAGNRWKNAELLGVDIAEHMPINVKFTQMDGRKFAVQHADRYPLVVANPPFDYIEKKKEVPELYCGAFSKYSTKRLEIEMLLANLFLLKENGTLLIILPSSFVEASSNSTIRKLIGQNYHVNSFIKLPEDTFGAANINSYALIIRNSTSRHRITRFFSIIRRDQKFITSEKVTIPQKNIKNGDWHGETQHTLVEELDMRRGNISSQFFTEVGTAILHTAKINTKWYPSLRYINTDPTAPVYAESGDIIVSRVGKSAGQWCQYHGERILISDCLYRIKDTDGIIINTIGGKEYNLAPKGVATRYITKDDFISWYYSIKNRITNAT